MSKSKYLVFVDVDDVLLDFSPLLLGKARDLGYWVPSDEQWQTRSKLHLDDAFPGVYDRRIGWDLCDMIFKEGQLKTQPTFDFHDRQLIGQSLSMPNFYILTKIPEFVKDDRVECLKSHFGVDLAGRIFCSWGDISKGDIMKEVCKREGVAIDQSVLIDDNPDYLSTALEGGSHGIMVEHCFNTTERDSFKTKYSGRFTSVKHPKLSKLLHHLSVGNCCGVPSYLSGARRICRVCSK